MSTQELTASEPPAEKRLKEFAGMALVGDGAVGLLMPERHCRLWEIGPEPCRNMIDWFARHPGLTRVLAAVEMGFGMWLASHQAPGDSA